MVVLALTLVVVGFVVFVDVVFVVVVGCTCVTLQAEEQLMKANATTNIIGLCIWRKKFRNQICMIVIVIIPSEIEVAARYKLLALFTLFTLFSL